MIISTDAPAEVLEPLLSEEMIMWSNDRILNPDWVELLGTEVRSIQSGDDRDGLISLLDLLRDTGFRAEVIVT